MASTAFETFVAPARTRPALWRLVLGLILAIMINIVSIIAIFAGFWFYLGQPRDMAWLSDVMQPTTPQSMFLLLSTFFGMALGAIGAARLLHRRPGLSVFGPAARLPRDFLVAATVGGVVLGGSVLGWSLYFDAKPNLELGTWLRLLPFALLGVLMQTGAEELLFRGYLQQQLAARFRSPILWLIFPSLLFGLVHYDPTSAGDNVWLVVGAAGVFGLAAADLTAQTGSIGASWGLHFVNNTIALVFIATEGTLTGLALYLTPYAVDDTDGIAVLMAYDLALLILCWWVLRRILRR